MKNAATFTEAECGPQDWVGIVRSVAERVVATGWDGAFAGESRCGELGGGPPNVASFAPFRQGAWSFLLEPRPGIRALAIDAALGATVSALRDLGGNVVAIQPSHICAEAVRRRVNGRAGGVDVVVGRLRDGLPFRQGSFDIVSMHRIERVLALYGMVFTTPFELLDTVGRLVRPGGTLFVSGCRAFRARSAPLVRAPSCVELVAALRATGWNVRALTAFSGGMDAPYALRVAFFGEMGPSWADTLYWGLRFANYGIVAVKGGRREALLKVNRLICATGRNQRVNSSAESARIHVGSNTVLRVHTATRVFRFPRTEHGMLCCSRNFRALEMLSRRALPFRVPAPIERGVDPMPYFVEERLPGRSMDVKSLSRREMGHLSDEGIKALTNFQSETATLRVVDEEFYRAFIEPEIQAAAWAFSADERSALPRVIEQMGGKVLGARVPMSMIHGDFKVSNFMVDSSRRVSGVVDWDRFSAVAPSFIDCVSLLSYNLALGSRMSWHDAILGLPEDKDFTARLRDFLRSCGGDEDLVSFSCLLTMVHYFNSIAPRHRDIFCLPHSLPRRLMLALQRYAERGEGISL